MAVDLLGSVVVVEEVVGEESLVIPANDCEKSTGTWTSSRNSRKTSTSSILTSPTDHQYVRSDIYQPYLVLHLLVV